MSTENNGIVQQALDVITGNSELRAILASDGIVVDEVNLDMEETIVDFMDMCGYSEEDATNAYNNLKDYE